MDGYLSNVTSLAVWVSLAATLILGTFFLVQAWTDRSRRYPFLLFAIVMAYLGGLDLARSFGRIEPLTYEWLRLWWAGGYAGCALWLLGQSGRLAIGTASALLLSGFLAFRFGD